MAAGDRSEGRLHARFSANDRVALDETIRKAEQLSRAEFSVFVGHAEGDPRAFATSLHASLVAPSRSVLIMVDPDARVLEVVTGSEGASHGSLLHEIDRTITSMGGRMLRAWVLRPLCALERIRDRLDAVGARAWDDLVAASRLRSPFLSWTWQCEWSRTFAEQRRLEIRCVEDDGGELVALLPLYESAPGVIELIGGADVSDYLDLIAVKGREEEAWTALLQSRTADTTEWLLHAVPEASPTVSALPTLASAWGLMASASVEERCPVLALPPSWEAYLARLSGKHRHELQRKMRRL